MTFGGNGIDRVGRSERLFPALVLATVFVLAISTSVSAQMFTDHPPPIPPGLVPDPGSAINLAPPSGPASIPSLPAPSTQPSAAASPRPPPAVPTAMPSLPAPATQPSPAAVPPGAAPPAASTAGQAVLSL